MAKKPFSKKPKYGHFGGPWAGRMGRMGRKGVARLRFGPSRTTGASFVKIGLGPPTVLRASYVQSLLKRLCPPPKHGEIPGSSFLELRTAVFPIEDHPFFPYAKDYFKARP